MDNEIARAFKNGDYKRASELLQKVRDSENIGLLWFYPWKYEHMNCNMYKVTLLHLAAYHGWLDICHQLITEYKYNPHVQYSFGSLTNLSTQTYFYSRLPPPPPLFYAALGGHYEVVKYLINKCNCDPHQQSEEGETPLYLACLRGHYEIVTYLINERYCDQNIGSSYNLLHDACMRVLLYKACRYGELRVVRFLVSLPSVGLNIQDDSGYTPLHTACMYGQLDIIKFLVSLPSVDVNIRDDSGYTPLHTACEYGQLDIIKFLVSLPSVDVKMRISNSVLLHKACRYGELRVVKFLVSLPSVCLNIQDDSGYTPLHTACEYGQLDIIKFLVSLPSVDVNIQDDSGYTPLLTACEYDQLDIIKFLVSLPSVGVNIRDDSGYTPLHIACEYGQLDIIKFLLSLPSVDVKMRISNSVLLHKACRYGELRVVKFLVSLPSVGLNIQDDSGYTPLHTACMYGQLDIIKFLVSLPLVDVNILSNIGHTPLHTSCMYSQLQVIKFLVSLSSVDVNIQSNSGSSPLHTACRYDQLDIVKFLMSTEKVNPMSTTTYSNTALHIACSYRKVDIVKYLLSTGRIDPMAENRYQLTPLQLAENDYDILKLFEPFVECKVDFPVESYSKVFLCGNTTNGKSSLAHALGQRVKGVSLLERLNPFKKQEKAEPLTAGIVPHHLQSIEIGNIVLYDFAGHPEYYSSHEAVLATVMLRSPAVFIILVKLTDKLEDIEKQLYYWARFIQNVCSRMSTKSQVIVVGSHADDKEAKNGKVLVEHLDLSRILKNIQQLEYKGFVAMDCRKQNGSEFDQFVTYLSESNQAVVDRSDSISFYCHVLYAFLTTKLKKVAVTLEDLSQMIQNENEPSLPSNESVLLAFLDALSDKGLIMFIRTIDSTSSWVIVDKLAILEKINGKLFAPSHFKEYTPNLSSNTGLVRVSDLEELFPQYNVDMLVGFLKSLEFCHEIDENTLKIITTNLSSSSDKLLYFPALVSVEPSSEVTITDGFGWCLWCPNPYQFFSTRFLQVLLLRIAYVFSYQVNDVGIIHRSPVQTLDRSCHVWKNGICWTRDGVKTVVQVSEQNRSIVLLVQPLHESLELESLQVRSLVIHNILQIKDEFCHSCDTQECLISNHHLNVALQDNLKNLSIFKIEDISRVLILKKMFVTSNMTESLNISSLLGQLEPYQTLSLSVIQQLFDDSKVSQCIPEHFFREIQERCRPIMDIYPVTRESSTYQSVRDHLNKFSIFVGRNPFVSNWFYLVVLYIISYFNYTDYC